MAYVSRDIKHIIAEILENKKEKGIDNQDSWFKI